jgi:transcription elongation factor GreA
MKKQFRLTPQGVDELKTELQHLIDERSSVADRIRTAREFGDLSENAEYSLARQEQDKNEARISEIQYILTSMELITPPKAGGKVQLGSKVTLEAANKKAKAFQVVGTVEADPLNGKISDESPIGQALLGKKVGEAVEIKTPAETVTYKITSIA